MVVSLRSSLQAKERELTEAMDRFLQEKVGAAKAQGELAATRARLETAQQHIASLQNKVHVYTVFSYTCICTQTYTSVVPKHSPTHTREKYVREERGRAW